MRNELQSQDTEQEQWLCMGRFASWKIIMEVNKAEGAEQ
jgi:hypothetical protein